MLSYIVSYLQPHRQWIDVLKLCTLTSHRAYISPFGNCIQIIRKLVGRVWFEHTHPEGMGFTDPGDSPTSQPAHYKDFM